MDDVLRLLERGGQRKAVAKTAVNAVSLRRTQVSVSLCGVGPSIVWCVLVFALFDPTAVLCIYPFPTPCVLLLFAGVCSNAVGLAHLLSHISRLSHPPRAPLPSGVEP